MCGIVGVVLKRLGGFSKKTEDVFLDMLYADAVRGYDSTGVIGAENDMRFHIAKDSSEATFFIPQIKNGPMMKGMWQNGRAYIGHNRKKTVGAIKDETAHPFVVDDTFAMVHNGTLYNHQKLAKTEVDSEALAIVLNKALKEEDQVSALEKTLAEVNGAYAIAAYDQTKHKVYLLRNNERPLSVIETDDAWYFASESLMAAWVLARNGYSYPKDLTPVPVPEHVLFSFDLKAGTLSKDSLTVKKATPPTKIISSAVTVGGVTRAGGGTKTIVGKGIADKDFKGFKKKWIGRRVTVWVDDHLEKYFPRTVDDDGETEVTLFGTLDEIPYLHSFQCLDVDLKNFNILKTDEFLESRWSMYVDDITRSSSGSITLHCKEAKPVPPSVSLDTARKAKNYRMYLCKVMLSELLRLKANKDKLEPWQFGCVLAEINQRTKFKNYEEAVADAKKQGTILNQVIRDGKQVYLDNEGNIFYESSATLH